MQSSWKHTYSVQTFWGFLSLFKKIQSMYSKPHWQGECILHINLWQLVIVDFIIRILHLCKHGTVEINHMNWEPKGKNVWVFRILYNDKRFAVSQIFSQIWRVTRELTPARGWGQPPSEKRFYIKSPIKEEIRFWMYFPNMVSMIAVLCLLVSLSLTYSHFDPFIAIKKRYIFINKVLFLISSLVYNMLIV